MRKVSAKVPISVEADPEFVPIKEQVIITEPEKPSAEVAQVLQEAAKQEAENMVSDTTEKPPPFLSILEKTSNLTEKDQKMKMYAEIYTTERTYVQCLEIILRVSNIYN